MAGLIQIIGYLLCIYLVFKGFEIYQIAISSPKEKNTAAKIIGTIAVMAGIIIAVIFTEWITNQAESISDISNSGFLKN